jgi:hypothetical protein
MELRLKAKPHEINDLFQNNLSEIKKCWRIIHIITHSMGTPLGTDNKPLNESCLNEKGFIR